VSGERHRKRNTTGRTRLPQALVVLAVAVAHAFCFESRALCAEPARVPTVRTFVPHEHPELWPAGDWIPIEPQVLENLLKSAGTKRAAVDSIPFHSAAYQATFNPRTQRLEKGIATLTRVRRNAGMTAFEPCNLALSDPHWSDSGILTDEDRRAILGTDPGGVKRLVTPKDARELSFKWSLSGRKRLTGIDFDIEVPQSVVSGFQLIVPVGWQVSSIGGVAYADSAWQHESSPDGTSGEFTAWRVDLGQLNHCRIRLHEPGTTSSEQQSGIITYRLNSRFHSRSEWLEQLFEFTFDTLSAGVDELTVAIPPELIVSAIEDGSGRAFSWRDTGPQPDKWHGLRIQIPAVSGPDSQRIVIRGNQPVPPPGSEQVQLRLEPPRPANAVLLGGNVNAVIESPLQIARYSSGGLRQTATSVDEERHELAFQQYSSEAYIELQIQNSNRLSARRLSVREYSLLDVGSTPQQFGVLLELTSQSQGIFTSSWLVPLEWEVTAVSLASSSAVEVSDIEKLSWSVTRDSDRHQKLVIDLADGLPVRRPLRLRVTAQRADRSRESRIPVPVILPEIARSVSVAFGITGCDEPHQTQIASDIYRRHSDNEILSGPAWDGMSAELGDSPQALWTADYWTLTDEVRSATLSLPSATSNLEDATGQTPGSAESGSEITGSEPAASDADPARSTVSTDNTQSQSADQPANAILEPEQVAGGLDLKLTQPMIVSAEFESQLSPSNVSRDLHRFSWKFHYSSAAAPFRFRLPPACELLAVTWRGRKVAPVQEDSEWVVPLALVNAGDELSVDYTLPSQDVYLRETYRCRIPTAEVTVIRFDWRVRLRTRYSVVSFSSELTPDEAERPGFWLSWCFGPLARNHASTVFNPFGRDSWIQFVQGSGAETGGEAKVGGEALHSRIEWQSFSASASGLPESLNVHVCDHSRLDALSWFVLTLSTLIGVLLRAVTAPHRSQFALIWLSGCVASVALVPGAYAELVGAAALGSILATLVPRTLVRPARKKEGDVSQIAMASTITRRIATSSVLLAGLSLAASAWAQPAQPALENAIDMLVPYFDSPFEDEAEPTFVHLRRADYENLVKSSTREGTSSPQLLLTKSRWDVNVAESGRTEIVSTIVAALHDDDARELEIPIPARFLTGQSGCSVNGLPVNVLPTADGSRLRVPLPDKSSVAAQDSFSDRPPPPPLPEPIDLWREYTIELHLRPLTVRTLESSRISLPIPAVLDSRLTLSFIRKPKTVFVGELSESAELTAEGPVELALGPADDLKVSWRQNGSGALSPVVDSTSLPDVEIRSSIEIHSTWMERRTHARYLLTEQAVRYIEWKLPAQCQVDLDQFRIRNLVDKELRRVGENTVLAIEFDPPMTEQFDFEFQWRQMQPNAGAAKAIVWPVPVAPGQVNVPLVVSSHFAGLSPEAGYQPSQELQELATASDVDGTSFVELWPEDERPRIPEMAFRISDATELIPDITPFRTQRTTRLSQEARIQPFGIQWTVSAEVDTEVAPAFTHEFRLHDSFRIDSVTVLEDDVDRLSHWEHENGKLFLHLRDRRSGVQNITIVGQQRIGPDGTVVGPRMEAIEGVNAESTLLVYRSRQLDVTVEGADVVNDDSVAVLETVDFEEFLGQFRPRTGQDTQLQIQRVPVEPSAWLFADFTSEGAGEVRVETTVHLHSMSRRNIQIDLPAWVSQSDSKVEARVDEPNVAAAITADRKTVNVTLPRPLPQLVRVTLSVTLTPGAGSTFPLEPPAVRDVSQQHAAIAVMLGMDEWEPLPGDSLSDLMLSQLAEIGTQSAGETVDIVAWTEATRLVRVSTMSDTQNLPPFVLHSIRPGIRRSGVSTTRILLQTDRTSVTLDWPKNVQLISALIDGRVENVLPSADVALVLPFAGHSTFHDIEVLWSRGRDSSAMKIQRRSIQLPRLRDVGSFQAFAIAAPSRGVHLIATEESSQPTVRHAVIVANRWVEFLQRGHRRPAILETARLMLGSLSNVTEESDGTIDVRPLTETNNQPADEIASSDESHTANTNSWLRGDAPTIVQKVEGSNIGLWVVDTRINRILGSILIGIVVLPFFVLFLRLETGDRIASHPELCWFILGLIWWLCLKGSGAGFLLGIVSGLWLAASYLRSRQSRAAALTTP
jgi:hypothetical protein